MATIKIDSPPRPETAEELRARLAARREHAAAIAETVPGAGNNALHDLLAVDKLGEVNEKTMTQRAQASGQMVYTPAQDPASDFTEYEVPAEHEEPVSRVQVVEGWA